MRVGFGVGERSLRFLRSRDFDLEPERDLTFSLERSRRRDVERERRFSLSALARSPDFERPFFSLVASLVASLIAGDLEVSLRLLRRSPPLEDEDELELLELELEELDADDEELLEELALESLLLDLDLRFRRSLSRERFSSFSSEGDARFRAIT